MRPIYIYSSGATSIIYFDDIKELLKKCNYCNVDKMSCEKLNQIMINASNWASILYRSDIYIKYNFKSNIDYEIYIKQFKNY